MLFSTNLFLALSIWLSLELGSFIIDICFSFSLDSSSNFLSSLLFTVFLAALSLQLGGLFSNNFLFFSTIFFISASRSVELSIEYNTGSSFSTVSSGFKSLNIDSEGGVLGFLVSCFLTKVSFDLGSIVSFLILGVVSSPLFLLFCKNFIKEFLLPKSSSKPIKLLTLFDTASFKSDKTLWSSLASPLCKKSPKLAIISSAKLLSLKPASLYLSIRLLYSSGTVKLPSSIASTISFAKAKVTSGPYSSSRSWTIKWSPSWGTTSLPLILLYSLSYITTVFPLFGPLVALPITAIVLLPFSVSKASASSLIKPASLAACTASELVSKSKITSSFLVSFCLFIFSSIVLDCSLSTFTLPISSSSWSISFILSFISLVCITPKSLFFFFSNKTLFSFSKL